MTKKKKKIHDQTYTKTLYEIKLFSMRPQIKSHIKDQIYFDTVLKSKKDSKQKREDKKSMISYYEFSLK